MLLNFLACLIIFLIGAAIELHTDSGSIVHIILYSTLGRRTELWRYVSCLIVSIFLSNLIANSQYSVRHCFLTKDVFLMRENQTPRNLNELFSEIGVIEKEEVQSLNWCDVEHKGVGLSESLGSLLVMSSALSKLILVLFIL